MLKMLKLLKSKCAIIVQQQIVKRFNKNTGGNKIKNYEDAAFLFFLDLILYMIYFFFLVFASISLCLFVSKEILSF